MSQKELSKQITNLRKQAFDLRMEWGREKADRTKALRDQIAAIQNDLEADYGKRIAEINQSVFDLEKRLGEMKAAIARDEHKSSIGQRMAKWEKPRPYLPIGDTGLRGVVDVWGPESRHPENVSSYRLPRSGELYIRILKKDGSPSLKCDRLTSWGDWYPEGVDPNERSK